MSDIAPIASLPSAQRERRTNRMTSRSQRLGLGSASNHGAEILKAIESVKLSQASTDIAPLPVQETDVHMSAQRQRRANRMTARRQRMKLGPVSDHLAEVALALQTIPTDQNSGPGAVTPAQVSRAIMDTHGASPSGTDSNETTSSDHVKILINDVASTQFIIFPTKVKRSPFWKRLLLILQRKH